MRSLLFVPAHDTRKPTKGLHSGADALIIDLEDAVPETQKAAIHPDQIGRINEAFTPSETDVAWAKRVTAAFVASPEAGAVAIDAKMPDRPHYRSTQRVLARAATPNNS